MCIQVCLCMFKYVTVCPSMPKYIYIYVFKYIRVCWCRCIRVCNWASEKPGKLYSSTETQLTIRGILQSLPDAYAIEYIPFQINTPFFSNAHTQIECTKIEKYIYQNTCVCIRMEGCFSDIRVYSSATAGMRAKRDIFLRCWRRLYGWGFHRPASVIFLYWKIISLYNYNKTLCVDICILSSN